MRALVGIEGRGWEAVVRGSVRYLHDDDVLLVHAIDERPPRGYDLSVRGLLGRRTQRSAREMISATEAAAEELLAEAKTLLRRLRPRLRVESRTIRGLPEEELVRVAKEWGAEVVFVGRGTPEAKSAVTASGIVRSWKRNRHGDLDGFYLEDGTEVRFPPPRLREIRKVVREGSAVEVQGEQRGEHLHAYLVTDVSSGSSVEAHAFPREPPGKRRLGHMARFVVDHAYCDVVILQMPGT